MFSTSGVLTTTELTAVRIIRLRYQDSWRPLSRHSIRERFRFRTIRTRRKYELSRARRKRWVFPGTVEVEMRIAGAPYRRHQNEGSGEAPARGRG